MKHSIVDLLHRQFRAFARVGANVWINKIQAAIIGKWAMVGLKYNSECRDQCTRFLKKTFRSKELVKKSEGFPNKNETISFYDHIYALRLWSTYFRFPSFSFLIMGSACSLCETVCYVVDYTSLRAPVAKLANCFCSSRLEAADVT